MSVTLKYLYDIMRNKENYKISLVAGERGVGNVVSWVHVIETESLTDFFEGGELIFTVGLNLDTEEKLLSFVKTVCGGNASGLVINIGNYVSEIPESVIDFCDKNDFPLLVIPWNLYIAKVMKSCSHEILSHSRRRVEIVMAFKNAIFCSESFSFQASMLEQYGFMGEWSYCVAVFDYFCEDEEILFKEIERLSVIFEKNLSSAENKSYVFTAGNQIIVIFTNRTDDEIWDTVNILNHYNFELKNKNIRVYAGIGRNTQSIRCLNKTYRIANDITRFMERAGEEYSVRSYSRLGILKIFLGTEDNEAVRGFCRDTLEPLNVYDRMNGTDYVEFLRGYFSCGCSAKAASEKMYIHRNTINYKLHKIEELTGRSLADFETRAELYLAIKLEDIL